MAYTILLSAPVPIGIGIRGLGLGLDNIIPWAWPNQPPLLLTSLEFYIANMPIKNHAFMKYISTMFLHTMFQFSNSDLILRDLSIKCLHHSLSCPLTSTEDQVWLWPSEQPDDHCHVRHHVQSWHKNPESQDQDQELPVKLCHDFWENKQPRWSSGDWARSKKKNIL